MEAVLVKVLLTLVLMLYFLQTDDEKEMVSRTVYCTNIDKKVCKPSSLVGCVCVCLQTWIRITQDACHQIQSSPFYLIVLLLSLKN